MHRVQDPGLCLASCPGLCNAQGAMFRSVLHTGCRVQECFMHRLQGSGMCYAQGAGFRNALGTGCSVQECILRRVQGTGVHYTQCAGFRGECITYRVQGSGLYYVQNSGFRVVLCTEFRVQDCATHRVKSLRLGLMKEHVCSEATHCSL